MSPEQKIQCYEALYRLISEDICFPYNDKEKGNHLVFCLDCSDFFHFACADSEEFELEESLEIERVYNALGNMGIMAWIGVRRGFPKITMQQWRVYRKKYANQINEYRQAMRKLKAMGVQ